VKQLLIDEGPTMKRLRFRSRGMASQYFRRTCHITAVVEDQPVVAKPPRAPRPKPAARKPAAAKPAAAKAAPKVEDTTKADEAAEVEEALETTEEDA